MDNSLFNLNYKLHLFRLYKRSKTIVNCLADLFIGKDVNAARQSRIVWPNYCLREIDAMQDNSTLSYRRKKEVCKTKKLSDRVSTARQKLCLTECYSLSARQS